MPFNCAYILPLTRSISSPCHIAPCRRLHHRRPRSPCRSVRHSRRPTVWRLAASSAGSTGTPPIPEDPLRNNDTSSSDPEPESAATSADAATPAGTPQPLAASLSLGDAAIAVDPIKKIPSALIDASGALQLDDGSFAAEAIIPRRLVPRKSRKPDFARVRSQLAAGFDSGFGSTLLLTSLFAVWYWANTAFNVFNKQVLRAFPFPLTCTVVQFAVAGAVMSSVWLLRGKKTMPRINWFVLRAVAPLAVLHAAGFLLTNMSLGRVSVAFTHTVKSTEPFFSVALTPGILGDVPTWGILGSLFPIVAGVAIASATDVSFNWPGFLSAMGSNLALQSRNVLSKRLMDTGSGKKRIGRNVVELSVEEEDALRSLDNMNLFSAMTILAFVFLAPVCVLWEGFPLLTSAVAPAVTGMPGAQLMRLLLVGGVCRCLDVLASYMILKRVSPVTHSIGNCVKRAVVIVASIFFFKTTMTSLNLIGTSLALTGVLIYSIIVSACKQNTFGPDSPFCRPIYTEEVELTEGGGI